MVKLNVSEEEEKRMREEMVERRRQAKMAKVVLGDIPNKEHLPNSCSSCIVSMLNTLGKKVGMVVSAKFISTNLTSLHRRFVVENYEYHPFVLSSLRERGKLQRRQKFQAPPLPRRQLGPILVPVPDQTRRAHHLQERR